MAYHAAIDGRGARIRGRRQLPRLVVVVLAAAGCGGDGAMFEDVGAADVDEERVCALAADVLDAMVEGDVDERLDALADELGSDADLTTQLDGIVADAEALPHQIDRHTAEVVEVVDDAGLDCDLEPPVVTEPTSPPTTTTPPEPTAPATTDGDEPVELTTVPAGDRAQVEVAVGQPVPVDIGASTLPAGTRGRSRGRPRSWRPRSASTGSRSRPGRPSSTASGCSSRCTRASDRTWRPSSPA